MPRSKYMQHQGQQGQISCRTFKGTSTHTFQVPSITLAMSTPSNNGRSARKWFKQKLSSVFSSSRSPSRNSEVRSTSTNVPPINSPSDGPRIIADRTGSGKKIGFIHDPRVLTHTFLEELSDLKPSLFTGSSTPENVTTSTSTTSLTFWLIMKDINTRP